MHLLRSVIALGVCCAIAGVLLRDAQAIERAKIERAAAVALGSAHSCAVTMTSHVRCWGWNDDGELGDGTTTSHGLAVEVAGLDNAVAVAAGYNHTCALTRAGGVECWGADASEQLGAPSSDRCNDFACSLRPIEVTGLTSGVSHVAAGFAHTCAVTTAGALKCWGLNLYGELGDGTMMDRAAPVDVSGLSNGVVAVAPGDVQTCALLEDGTVKCWGNNLLGELGDGTRTASLTPVTVCRAAGCPEPLGDIQQLAAGKYHACALDAAGVVFCWGSNVSGQLGVASAEACPDSGHPCSTVPLPVSGLAAPATAIAASLENTCALLETGAIECWGRFALRGETWPAPTPIEAWQSGFTAIAPGQFHACAVNTQQELSCFGANAQGQLGDGTMVDRDSAGSTRVWLLSGRGDADCDETVSSIDALFVLQLVASLMPGLPCPDIGAGSGQELTSLDALSILQFSAGLLS